MKTLKEKIDSNKQATAKANFAGYVQSVAFTMTLSKNMVDMLEAVRDYQTGQKLYEQGDGRIQTHTVPLLHSLSRRGLVWHDYVSPAPAGHRYHKLTRAGELMCELLVEAGLIQALTEKVKRKRA